MRIFILKALKSNNCCDIIFSMMSGKNNNKKRMVTTSQKLALGFGDLVYSLIVNTFASSVSSSRSRVLSLCAVVKVLSQSLKTI